MDFLVGVKETGEILGWDRRKVSTYHLRGVLPKPVTILSSGPIWLRKQIEYYKTKKESRGSIYYIIDEIVYKCCYNQPMIKTDLTYEEIKGRSETYHFYEEKDIRILRNAILEKNQIVQFLSVEVMIVLHDLGILDTEVFKKYIHEYSYENSLPTLEGMKCNVK